MALVVVPTIDRSPRASAAAPSAAFDWSMPDRFGLDRNADGITDYVDGATDVATGYDPTPGSWRVDLDACASTGDGPLQFRWNLIDQPDPAAPLTVQGGPGCGDFFMEVPEEGTYRLDLVVESNGVPSAPRRHEVVVQDWLIVAMGDSYGSGEGAPDIPIDQSDLAAAEAAWADVDAKLQQLTTLQADVAPLQAAIARWDAAVHELYRCDPSHPHADAGLCAVAVAMIAAESTFVVGELVALGFHAAVETVGDAIAAVDSLIQAAEATWQAAVTVAQSITGELTATWQAERCHRSARSGSAQAARALEALDPRTSVTFVHLACSGATMTYGMLGWYEGTEHPEGVTNAACAVESTRPAACLPPQVDVAEQLVGEREVDAVYVSVGGNDAHFADIVIACIVQTNCSQPNPVSDPGQFLATLCPTIGIGSIVPNLLDEQCRSFFSGLPPLMDTAAELIQEGIHGDVREPIDPTFPGLATGYGRLAQALVGDGALLPVGDEERMFLSEYVDAVKRHDGSYCDFGTMGLASIPGLSETESRYIDEHIVPSLAGAIEAATVAHGWTFVDGIYDGFTNHGYCADPHYMVRLQETFLIEGRYHGMVHPNESGYSVYAANILDGWMAQFYPGGLSAPRRPDQAPFADAGAGSTVAEGSQVTLTNDTWDGDGDAITYSWSHDRPGAADFVSASASTPVLRGIDDTSGTVTLVVDDEDGSRTDTAAFAVTNVAPALATPTGLDAPVALGAAVNATAPFTDAGASDTHSGTWTWGDGTSSPAVITEAGGQGSASGSHTYAATGLYLVTLTLDDDDGGSTSVTHEYAVVYDPSGGFATGGGWFQSPAGAVTPADTTDVDVTGTARFAFVSKYARGATVPSGNTAFRFAAAGIDFDSTTYDWMVISGAKATYRGEGTLNGAPGYRFVLSAVDGDANGARDPDRIRVRIWHAATGAVAYDNQAADTIDSAARTTIGGGSISVHGPKG